MKKREFKYFITALIVILITAVGCERQMDELELATYPATPEVFIDGFSSGLYYSAYGTSKVSAFSVDNEVKYSGTASMKFEVPDADDPNGSYVGGVFGTNPGRDLSGYNVLTFWAKASQPATLNEVGFGNDMGESKYQVTLTNVAVNSNWMKYYVPFPDPSVLKQERGMFFYAASPMDGKGYTFWIDEVKFEKLGTIAHPNIGILNGNDSIKNNAESGEKDQISDLYAAFNLPTGIDQKVSLSKSYFKFTSSNPSVVTVNDTAIFTVINSGSAVISAKVGNIAAKGSLTINSIGQPVGPAEPAPTPAIDSKKVVSLFSNAYTNVKVDSWNTHWQYSTAENSSIQVKGNDVIRYRNLNFVGIEFTSQPVDASAMTNFHLDIWTPDATTGKTFKIMLIDFGQNGVYGGGDDVSSEVSITSPALTTQNWISVDIPLSKFTGLTTKSHLAQLVLSGDLPNVYMDNVYFYKSEVPYSFGNPIDFESPGYGAGWTWSVFENSTNPALQFVANPNPSGINTSATVAKFTALTAGQMWAGSQTENGAMGTFNLDAAHRIVKIMVYKTVKSDVGIKFAKSDGWSMGEIKVANTVVNAWQELTFDFSAQVQNGYTQIIVFPDFTARTSDNVIYFDNITFSGGSTTTQPTTAAPTPAASQANVISVFSDAYTNLTGTDMNPNWGQSTVVSQVSVAGNNTLKLAGLNYQGIQLGSNQNVSGMGFLHLDVWSANSTSLNLYLISPGPVEKSISITVPTSGWTSLGIPLSSFSPVDLSNVIQFKFEGNGDVFMDNIYFYKTGGTPLTEPATAAPTPTASQANVISVFSDAYTNISGTDMNPNWGQSTVVSQIPVAGNNTLKYTGLNYQGIALGSNQDVSGMGYLHVDVWSANSTLLNVSLISPGPAEKAYKVTVPTSGWTSLNIPLSSFSGVDLKSVMQLKFDGNGNIWIDNIYFYKSQTGGAYSLSYPIDFESSGYGAGWTWNVFENATGPALEFVANPDKTGVNTSATVAKFTALKTGQPWAGSEVKHGAMGTFKLDATNSIVKIMVYKTVKSDVGIKFAKSDGWSMGEIKVANTVINAWQELTFNFTAQVQDGYDQIIVFPDFNARTSDNVVYFDNITFGK